MLVNVLDNPNDRKDKGKWERGTQKEITVIFQDTKMEKTSPLVALGTFSAIVHTVTCKALFCHTYGFL